MTATPRGGATATSHPMAEREDDMGDLVNDVRHTGAEYVITRNGKPAARLTPIEEPAMTTTYAACIGLLSDVVPGDYCDVMVVETEAISYREDSEGNEAPEYTLTDRTAMDQIETDVRVDGDRVGVEAAADKILSEAGWRRTGEWEYSDNAAYADVERT